tara:strand:+ start:3792 stop:4625 length:834 start_codon:yes stop_codon:yes gene_type:complete
MSNKIYYINGKFIENEKAKVSFFDSAFLYGDGIFETIRFENKKLCLINKHLDRLNNGFSTLDLIYEKKDYEIIELLDSVIRLNDFNRGLLRLIITRGNIEGSAWEYNGKPNTYISINPLVELPPMPVKVVFLDEKKYPIVRFNPAIKSMNYGGNMKAKKDAYSQDAFEPVFYNKDRFITECAIRNIFFVKDNELYTPSLDLGILSGVMRDTVLDIASEKNIKINQAYINFDEINNFDEAFISSTGIGVVECFWDGWSSDYKITKKIKKSLAERLTNH